MISATMGRCARIDAGGSAAEVRVLTDGAIVPLEGGAPISAAGVRWLPPVLGTAVGIALNYRAHVSELAHELKDAAVPEHPVLFIKARSTFVGHGHPVIRPPAVRFMHYEGELGVVIGRRARRVRRQDALACVRGYTVCNDFTVRDYVENFYRPPVKAKGFDTFGPIGPWVVDAADVGDPHDLELRTFVNGEVRQRASTRDLMFKVDVLIEFITAFMTLEPGDTVWTGTPAGVTNVVPGDTVRVEIDRVGALENMVVADPAAALEAEPLARVDTR